MDDFLMEKEYIELTHMLPVKTFREIIAFVLKNGDRKTYCNKYNNSPHYTFGTFAIYLNPVSQFINWSAENLSNEMTDYDEVVIQDFREGSGYYHLTLHAHKVLLDNLVPKGVELLKNEYLPIIEKALKIHLE